MNSTEKVIWLLHRLGKPPYEMGLSELAKEIGYGKSGIYKILSILVREGFVCQNTDTKKYFLGPMVYCLGSVYSNQKGIQKIAEPIMRSVHEATGETVSIGIREGDKIFLAYTIESKHSIKIKHDIGQTFPINAGAIGKVLTAYRDSNEIRMLLSKVHFEKKTPNTIVDKEELWKEYEKIRTQGYALSDEEHAIGGYGISAPIKDRNGKVWACLSLSGPKIRFSEDKINQYRKLVCEGAMKISSELGFNN